MAGVEGASIFVRVGADLSDLSGGLAQASASLQGFGRDMMRTGATLSAGLTAPLALLGKAAVTEAAQYETNMNLIQATTGATAAQMQQFGQTAIALGADLTLPNVSAADAAAAMLEMAKAGLSVNDVLGAARGTIQLAAAGDMDIADAAQVAANTLNAFGLQGEEATRIADLLAAAANASSASVASLADGYRSAAGVFAAAGVPVEDLTTAEAQLANAGLDGYHAGTSLRRMLLSLENPTNKASDAMDAIGFHAYDASGKMKDWGTIIGELGPALSGLTQEQRDATLATIFGTYAVSAANILLKQGAEGFDTMRAAVTKQGAAAALSGARMKGLQGAIDGLSSTASTLGLTILLPLLPIFAGLIRSVSAFISGLQTLNPQVVNAALAFVAVFAAVGPLLLALGSLTVLVGFLISPLGLLVLGLASFAAIAVSTPAVLQALTDAASALFGVLSGTTSLDTLIAALGTLGSSILAVVLPPLQALATQVWGWVTQAVAEAPAQLAALTAAIVAWATTVGPQVLAAGMELGAQLAAGISQGLATAMAALGANADFAGPLGGVFSALNDALVALQPAIDYLTPHVQALAAAFVNLGNVIGQQAQPVLQALGPLLAALGPVVSVLAPLIGQVLVFAIRGMIGVWTEAINLFAGAIPVATSVAVGAINLLTATILTISTITSQVVAIVSALLAGEWATAWNGALALVVTVTTGMNTVAQAFGTALLGIITTTLTQLGVNWQAGWNAMQAQLSASWTVMQAILDAALAAVLAAVSGKLAEVKGQIDASLAVIQSAWDAAWNLLPSSVQNALSSVVASISSFGSEAYAAAYAVGSDIVSGLVAGIVARAGEVAAAAANLVTSAIGAARAAADSHSPSVEFQNVGSDMGDGLVLGMQMAIPAALVLLQTRVSAWITAIAKLLQSQWGPAWRSAANDVVQAAKIIQAAVDETARHVRNLLELLQHVPGAHITIPKIDLPPAPADSGSGTSSGPTSATAAPVTVNVFPQEASLDADQLWRLVNRQLSLQGVA